MRQDEEVQEGEQLGEGRYDLVGIPRHHINQTGTTLLEIVNRDRVVINRIKIKLGDKSVMDFFAEVEDQVKLTRANMEQITEN